MKIGDTIESGVRNQGPEGAADGGVQNVGPVPSVDNGDFDGRESRATNGGGVAERGRCEGENKSLEHLECCGSLGLFFGDWQCMIEGLENCSVIVYRLPIVSMVGELAFICVVLLGATRTKDMMVLAILSARCQSGLISMKRST